MLAIEIPGEPLAQKRVRFRQVQQGKMWAYDPDARDKIKIQHVIREAIERSGNTYKFEYPDVSFVFYMHMPKTMRKGDKKLAEQELLRHVNKPDIDNLIKLYLDCMLKTVLTDDRMVAIAGAVKLYSPRPRTLIMIQEGSRVLSPCSSTRSSHDFLVSDKPSPSTIDVPPYSEVPCYSDDPRLLAASSHLRSKGGA